jgi:hypothetical protein
MYPYPTFAMSTKVVREVSGCHCTGTVDISRYDTSVGRALESLIYRINDVTKNNKERDQLRAITEEFVHNVVTYFQTKGMDDYTLANLLTALLCSNKKGQPMTMGKMSFGEHYSTFIRVPDVGTEDHEEFFVVGRDGDVEDCVLSSKEVVDKISRNSQLLFVYTAFKDVRDREDGNGSPRIPRADMIELVPAAVRGDEELFELFAEVCLSDGAYANLYKDLFMRG